MQSFLKTPNFSKDFFFKQPRDLYQEFCNAYAYYKQATLCDPKPNRQKLIEECTNNWKKNKQHDAAFIRNKIREYYETIPPTVRSYQRLFISHDIINSDHTSHASTTSTTSTIQRSEGFIDTSAIPKNAVAQHKAAEQINLATKNISEYQQMIEITTDNSLKNILTTKIIEKQKTALEQSTRLRRLKRHAEAQAKLATKKKIIRRRNCGNI